MGVELLRIDDRLIHGQVVEGWLKNIRVHRIVVASDTVQADETQKALWMLAVPSGIELSCLSLQEAAHEWKNGTWKNERVLVLVSTPDEAFALLENGAPIKSVNLGGLHFRQGRVQILKGISLDDADVRALQAMAGKGVMLEARALPLDEPVNMTEYLKSWQQHKDELREQPR